MRDTFKRTIFPGMKPAFARHAARNDPASLFTFCFSETRDFDSDSSTQQLDLLLGARDLAAAMGRLALERSAAFDAVSYQKRLLEAIVP